LKVFKKGAPGDTEHGLGVEVREGREGEYVRIINRLQIGIAAASKISIQSPAIWTFVATKIL
jgi:hypothetical protein